MPQRAGERARHAAIAPERFAAFHALLVAELPQFDRALVGHPAILAYLASLGIRRVNHGPLTVGILQRWRREHGLPLLPGGRTLRGVLTPPLSTTYALTAWLLSRWRTGDDDLFTATTPNVMTSAPVKRGKRPRENSSQCPRRAA